MGFNRLQPRDEDGKWTDGGIGGGTPVPIPGPNETKAKSIYKALNKHRGTPKTIDQIADEVDTDDFEDTADVRRTVVEMAQRQILKSRFSNGAYVYWLPKGKLSPEKTAAANKAMLHGRLRF